MSGAMHVRQVLFCHTAGISFCPQRQVGTQAAHAGGMFLPPHDGPELRQALVLMA